MMNERVIFITGGAQGIGRAMVDRFLAAGDRIAVADADRQALREAQESLPPHGDLLFLNVDVSKESQVRSALQRTIRRFGRLDLLINNAGLVIDPTPGFRVDLWQQVIGVNLTGAFYCARHAIPYLRKTKGGIINIASTRALMSEPNTEAYSASKGGLLALTHSLAISLGPDIRVNCISPGWIDTSEWQKSSKQKGGELRPIDHQQHPAGRVGRPEDIAALAFFLASAEAAFITGQNIISDGGMTRKMVYA
jgi:NAD(P)-dependent dehydrogenase (short-subunit alcohol dehydrogenase family)